MLHHSGTVDTKSLTWGIIRSNHKSLYPQADHPYHYGVEWIRSSYEILMGRMPDIKGAHCRAQRMNHIALGICMVGNFDMAPPAKAQWKKTLELVRFLMFHYAIPKENVIGHRNVKETNCPGRFFDLGKFRLQL
jgi:hypothetical protein